MIQTECDLAAERLTYLTGKLDALDGLTEQYVG